MNFLTTHFIGRTVRTLCALLSVAVIIPAVATAQSPLKVPLLSAGNYVIIANQTITSTGGGTIDGNIALSPGTSLVGFPPGKITGTKDIANPLAAAAQVDLTAAYNDAAGRASTATIAGNIGGQTLVPGVYKSTSSVLITSGDLTLDAKGDANGVWIFQIASTLTTGTNVILAGGAQAKNIFWQVGTSATLGSGSIFYGTILANVSITMNSTVVMVGRSLARTGSVTANGTGAENPDSVKSNTPIFSPIFTTVSHTFDVSSKHVDSTGILLVTIANTGTADLTITASSSSNTHFSSHLSSTTIAAGKTIIDTVKFVPTSLAADSGFLIFTHNAATSPDTLKIHGTVANAVFSTLSRNINVGSTHIDTALKTIITITNTGTDTLKFSTLKSTNPAFTSGLSALFIAPGGSVKDTITFLPTAVGADSAKLIFLSNGTSAPDTIRVTGTGTNGALRTAVLLRIKQGTTNAIGDIHVGKSSWRIDTLKNTGTDTLRIASSTSTNASFTSHLSAMVIAPGARILDSIRYVPTKVGADTGKMTLISNATTSPDTITVTSNGISGIFTTVLRSINCGTTQINTATTTFITIINTGNDILTLTPATSTSALFTSHLSGTVVQPGAWVVDTIRFKPTAVGAAAGKLIFVSDAVSGIDTIAVYGTGVDIISTKAAILATSTRSVNCGSVQVGKFTSSVITISNTGTDTLRLTSVSSSDVIFSSHMSAMKIAPGAYVIDTIRFAPTTVGTHFGEVMFVSNAVNSPDTISVYGLATTAVGVHDGATPTAYVLGEVYPNPFSDATQLRVTLQNGEQMIHAAMYDMLGRELQDFTSRISSSTTLSLHLGVYPKGEYFFRFRTTDRMQVLPVMIVK